MEEMLTGPLAAFERFRDMVLAGGEPGLESILADDGVVESPFAVPRLAEGRAAFAARARAGRAAMAGRVRFTDVRGVVVHQTTDPAVAVVEYEIEAVRLADGLRAAAPFAVVVRVKDGRVALWREYQNPAAMALATE